MSYRIVDPGVSPDYLSFLGAAPRPGHVYGPDGPPWSGNRFAPLVMGMLSERHLDWNDVEIDEDDGDDCMTIQGQAHAIQLFGNLDDPICREEAALLAAELDHRVAWRTRDMMIEAVAGTASPSMPWVSERSYRASGLVEGPRAGRDWIHPLPFWAVTVATTLRAHLARVGKAPADALEAVCRSWHGRHPEQEDSTDVAGVAVSYAHGRLWAREEGDGFVLDDHYGLALFATAAELPECVSDAAPGRRLSELVGFERPPLMLTDVDPVVVSVETVGSHYGRGTPAGTRIGLQVGTETVADVPPVALAAIGDHREAVDRSEKPWLRRRLPVLPRRPRAGEPRLPFP